MARTIRARMQRLRRDYPHPRMAREGWDGRAYCVGGALCLLQGVAAPWPDHWTLTRALTRENPHLPGTVAWDLALGMIRHNEVADFAQAWRLLEAALRWRPPRPQKGRQAYGNDQR